MEVSLNVPSRINAALKAAKLTSLPRLLSLSGPDIQRMTKLSASDVQNLIEAAAESIPKPPTVTAHQLNSADCPAVLKRSYLSTGCSVMDGILGEGIPSQMVVEVCGESGSGKTQLCLQFCLTAQLSVDSGGLNGGALYICTEDAFPNRRLVRMVERLQLRHADLRSFKFTNNIYIEHIADTESLCQYLENRVTALLSAGKVKLLVLDSIAALFRADQSGSPVDKSADQSRGLNFVHRSRQLSAIAKRLHTLANQYNITVIVVNQVTDDFSLPAALVGPLSRQKVPALGLAWSNLISMRLQLFRTENRQLVTSDECRYETTVRRIEVVVAPHLPKQSVRFIIDEDGVKGIDN